MAPTLYEWYSVSEAIAAFGNPRSGEFLCDGQFAVLPNAILCFATLGEPGKDPYLLVPSSFAWKPDRLDYDPADEIPWLPTKAREVWGPNREWLKDHHIFLRTRGDEQFVYVGRAHLGSCGNNGIRGNEEAGFSLDAKLPRDIRLRLGCYPGWLVELNHQGNYFLDKNDLTGFQRIVAALPLQEYSHLYVTRYEEDSLSVYLNRHRGCLYYQRSLRDFGTRARDFEPSNDPNGEEFFPCTCGIDLEVPAKETLPRELCMRAAVEFFQAGELPRCVYWDFGERQRL